MKWQDAVKRSKDGVAWRDDDDADIVCPYHWCVEADGTGEMYDDGYTTGLKLTPFDRDRWEDWEPDDPKDAVTMLSEVIDE